MGFGLVGLGNLGVGFPETLGCPVVPLFPFWGFRFPFKPLLAKKGTLVKPRLLGSLEP